MQVGPSTQSQGFFTHGSSTGLCLMADTAAASLLCKEYFSMEASYMSLTCNKTLRLSRCAGQ